MLLLTRFRKRIRELQEFGQIGFLVIEIDSSNDSLAVRTLGMIFEHSGNQRGPTVLVASS